MALTGVGSGFDTGSILALTREELLGLGAEDLRRVQTHLQDANMSVMGASTVITAGGAGVGGMVDAGAAVRVGISRLRALGLASIFLTPIIVAVRTFGPRAWSMLSQTIKNPVIALLGLSALTVVELFDDEGGFSGNGSSGDLDAVPASPYVVDYSNGYLPPVVEAKIVQKLGYIPPPPQRIVGLWTCQSGG